MGPVHIKPVLRKPSSSPRGGVHSKLVTSPSDCPMVLEVPMEELRGIFIESWGAGNDKAVWPGDASERVRLPLAQ